MRRRPPERPRRVRIGRQHAQDVESVERRVSRDATRAHSLCAAPASSQTVRRLLADTSTGAGLVRRRPPGRPRRVRVARRQTQGVGRVERSAPPDADRAHGRGAAPASSRTAVDRSSTPRRAQVECIVALSNGRVVSGSVDNTLKVWDDVEGMMARLVALRRLYEMNVNSAGRLIAKYL